MRKNSDEEETLKQMTILSLLGDFVTYAQTPKAQFRSQINISYKSLIQGRRRAAPRPRLCQAPRSCPVRCRPMLMPAETVIAGESAVPLGPNLTKPSPNPTPPTS
jgi:hypothetical protein